MSYRSHAGMSFKYSSRVTRCNSRSGTYFGFVPGEVLCEGFGVEK